MAGELKDEGISSSRPTIDNIHKRRKEDIDAIKALTEIVKTMTPEQIAKALQVEKRKTERAQKHAVFDSLTGLLRRIPFVREAKREMELAKREPSIRGLTFALGDLDNFGVFDKNRGVNIGDEVLKGLGEKLKKKTRDTDFVSRWGGDEIALTLPYSKTQDQQLATAIIPPIERLRKNIDEIEIEEDGKKLTEKVSFTFGATEYIPGETFKEAFGRMTRALRIAKLLGKERTVLAENGLFKDLSSGDIYSLDKNEQGEILTNTSKNTKFRVEQTSDPEPKQNLVKLG